MAKSSGLTDKPARGSRTGTVARTARKRTSAATDKPAGDKPVAMARKKTAARRSLDSARARPAKLPKTVAGAVRAALDKKAEDVVVLDLRKADGFTDYFVIATGANPRQITAIADGVRETLKRDFGERPTLSEGIDRSEWILLDYFDFVVHIFSRDCRSFYQLERLWGTAERYEFREEHGPATTSTTAS